MSEFHLESGSEYLQEEISRVDVDEILSACVAAGASDIIVSEFEGAWILKLGVVEVLESLTADKARNLFFAILDRMHTEPAALRGGAVETSFTLAGQRFRVSAFEEVGGGRIVLRVLSRNIPTPEEINIPQILLDSVTRLSQGMILLCGPTGCGKTTSIASVLYARGKNKKEHVVTLEDPVEYLMPHDVSSIYSQREIGRDEPTFAQGLKAALRQSPHVIVIGEIRDSETACTALEASETGHLVVATIHATSSDMTIQRYVQMIERERQDLVREQLATNVELIVCQRLCKAEGGYRGRVAIHEVMIKTHATTNCIRKGQAAELRNEIVYGAKKGHITFERSIKRLQESGRISPSEHGEMMAWLYPQE
ncbi:MAG: type IV pilus twitching motility protein PilT [Verrucomicrobiota bacterium]